MTAIDYSIITIVFISLVLGCFRGFVRELLALSGWILAFYCANYFSDSLYSLIPFDLDSNVKYIAAYISIFIVILIFASLVIKLFNRFVKNVGLGLSNFIIGGAFGFIRGVLIIFILSIVLEKTSFSVNPGWIKSIYIPIIKNSVENTLPYLPEQWFKDVKYDNILT